MSGAAGTEGLCISTQVQCAESAHEFHFQIEQQLKCNLRQNAVKLKTKKTAMFFIFDASR